MNMNGQGDCRILSEIGSIFFLLSCSLRIVFFSESDRVHIFRCIQKDDYHVITGKVLKIYVCVGEDYRICVRPLDLWVIEQCTF